MNPTKAVEDSLKADDVREFLSVLGWEEVVKPELDRMSSLLSRQLVGATLGVPVPGPNGRTISPEQIAGRIEGIAFIQQIIQSILAKGDKAKEYLNSINSNPFGDLIN